MSGGAFTLDSGIGGLAGAAAPEGLLGVVADALDDAEALGPALAEEQAVAGGEVLGPLDEAEGDGGAVAGADELAVDVDDGAGLGDGADVEHGLVARLDGGGVGEDEDLGDELAVDAGRGNRGVGGAGEDDHALADLLALDALEGERGRLAGAGGGDADALALDAADGRGVELAEGVGADEDLVAGVGDAGADDARDDGAGEGHGEGVVDVELEGGVGVVAAVVGEYVEERADEVEVLARHVGHHEDGADALADELRGRVDALLAVADEGGYLAGAGRLHDLGDLRHRLGQDVGRADVDLGHHHHDGHVERQRDAQVLLGHAHQAVVGRHHEEAVVRAAREEAKDGGAEVFFVPGQVAEGDDLCRPLADFLPGEFPCMVFM